MAKTRLLGDRKIELTAVSELVADAIVKYGPGAKPCIAVYRGAIERMSEDQFDSFMAALLDSNYDTAYCVWYKVATADEILDEARALDDMAAAMAKRREDQLKMAKEIGVALLKIAVAIAMTI